MHRRRLKEYKCLECDNITFYCEFEERLDNVSYEIHKFGYLIVWEYDEK